MVYEANARIRDPVYGSAGAICHLQKQLSEVQAQLARAQAELVNMQCQQANLLAVLCMEVSQTQECSLQQQPSYTDTSCFLDDNSLGSTWEPLWTWTERRMKIFLIITSKWGWDHEDLQINWVMTYGRSVDMNHDFVSIVIINQWNLFPY